MCPLTSPAWMPGRLSVNSLWERESESEFIYANSNKILLIKTMLCIKFPRMSKCVRIWMCVAARPKSKTLSSQQFHLTFVQLFSEILVCETKFCRVEWNQVANSQWEFSSHTPYETEFLTWTMWNIILLFNVKWNKSKIQRNPLNQMNAFQMMSRRALHGKWNASGKREFN